MSKTMSGSQPSLIQEARPNQQSEGLTTCRTPRRLSQGLTLIELVITIAIVAILLGVAIPSFSEVVANSRMSSSANELLGALQTARSEAVTRKIPVAICTSDEAVSLDSPGCKTSVDWNAGWVIFLDRDNNGTRDTGSTSTESVVQVHEALSGAGVTAIGTTNVAHNVRYVSDGTANASGDIVICDSRGASKNKAVRIEQYTGRTYTQNATGSCP